MHVERARELLNKTVRHEFHDEAFEDVEVQWYFEDHLWASGYFSKTKAGVWFSMQDGESIVGRFYGDDALSLLDCGEQGPIVQGRLSGGMTIESVVEQLFR